MIDFFTGLVIITNNYNCFFNGFDYNYFLVKVKIAAITSSQLICTVNASY